MTRLGKLHGGVRAAGVAVLFGVAAMGIAAAAPPGLSVTIDNGQEEIPPNSETTYTAELSNTGPESVTATLVVTLPDYASVEESAGGAVSGQDASWTVTVDPGATEAVTVRASVGEIPEGLFRVTTLVSVYLGEVSLDDAPGSPVIRSADSDRIPGVIDPSTVSADTHEPIPKPDPGVDLVSILVVGGGVAVMLALAALILWRRARVKPLTVSPRD